MPYIEPLGSSEKDQFELLSKINPDRRKWRQRSRGGYARHVNCMLNLKPERDKDIERIVHRLVNRIGAELEIEKIVKTPDGRFITTIEPTSYGLLRDEVERLYKYMYSKRIYYPGRGLKKEMVILWLFFRFALNRLLPFSFSEKEIKEVINRGLNNR